MTELAASARALRQVIRSLRGARRALGEIHAIIRADTGTVDGPLDDIARALHEGGRAARRAKRLATIAVGRAG